MLRFALRNANHKNRKNKKKSKNPKDYNQKHVFPALLKHAASIRKIQPISWPELITNSADLTNNMPQFQ
jgi:hypothetical protein